MTPLLSLHPIRLKELSSSVVKHVALSAPIAVHTINYVIHVGDRRIQLETAIKRRFRYGFQFILSYRPDTALACYTLLCCAVLCCVNLALS